MTPEQKRLIKVEMDLLWGIIQDTGCKSKIEALEIIKGIDESIFNKLSEYTNMCPYCEAFIVDNCVGCPLNSHESEMKVKCITFRKNFKKNIFPYCAWNKSKTKRSRKKWAGVIRKINREW